MSKNTNKYTKTGIENKIDSLDVKVESINTHLNSIAIILEKNTVSLFEHMKRSEHLETIVLNIKEIELKPLQKHVTMVHGVLKFIGIISLLVGIITGIAGLFHLI